MALSKEDKKDVKGAFGKAIANKVAKVTRDKYHVPGSTGRMHPLQKMLMEKEAAKKDTRPTNSIKDRIALNYPKGFPHH